MFSLASTVIVPSLGAISALLAWPPSPLSPETFRLPASFVRIFVGENDIQQLNKEKTSITGESVISIIPAIAGGVK